MKISVGNTRLFKEMVEKSRTNESDIVPTHYKYVDMMIGGFCNTDLILIAARPSMGKSSLMLNLVKHQAKLGKSVAVFSLEMSEDLLRKRFICDLSDIDSVKMQSKTFNDTDIEKMRNGFEVLDTLPIFINDDNDITTYQIKSEARRIKNTHGLNIIYIDYVQFMVNTADRNLTVQQQIPAITKCLKSLAKELKIPVVLLCQLNRGVEGRENKLPRMSDLKDSGSLEQDADIVMFLHRDDYYNKNKYSEFEEEDAKLFIAKNRNGKTGIVELVYKKKFFRFEDKLC
jgi:replicative DNA helicase